MNSGGKVLKFNLAMNQEKPCLIPYMFFHTDEQTIERIEEFQETGNTVWLKGKVSCYEFEYNGKTIRKIEIDSYPGAQGRSNQVNS